MEKFEILKTDFQSYVADKIEMDDEEPDEINLSEGEENSGNGISLFEYADEFKAYLEEKIPENSNEIKSKSVEDILKMDLNEGRLINKNKEPDDINKKETTEEDDEKNTSDMFTDVFNELMKEDKFKNSIDIDSSGEITKEELKKFLMEIKGYDEGKEDVSVDDLLIAAEQIKNNVFFVPDSEDEFTENEITEIEGDMTDKGAEIVGNLPSRSNIGGVPYTGGRSYYTKNGGYFTRNLPNTYDKSKSVKTAENMSEAELKQELEKLNKEIASQEKSLSRIIEGSAPEIALLQENADKAYNIYQQKLKAVDSVMANKINDLKKKIDKKQKEINEKNKAIASKEIELAKAETLYKNAKSRREYLENLISGKKSNDDNSSDLNSKLKSAQKAEKDAKKSLDKIQKELNTLNEGLKQLTEGENGLNKLNEEMEKLKEEAVKKHNELKDSQSDWDKAQKNLMEGKATAQEEAKTKVNKTLENADKVQTEQINYQNNAMQNKYSNEYNEAAGNKIAQEAHNVAGTVGRCLAGVADTLDAVYGAGTFPPISSAYQAADILASNEGIGAHFTEVQVSREELANLPKGAVVVWDNNANGGGSNVSDAGRVHGHISIALGDGQESSDHIQAQITNRDATFRVFFPKS